MKARTRCRIDDVVDAFAVHGANGAWGCIATGLFHRSKGVFTVGDGELLGKQILGVVTIAALGGGATFLAAMALHKLKALRVTSEQEITGLDAEFGLTAYVEKSQNLRRCEGAAGMRALCGRHEGAAS